ncbi:MAG: DNA polymerase III subunit alpha [Candidatus Eremiobacteraeota bacterium]|nr:DNA polymerase III subunit alpha [Candidatus Eremiobacteraeota bacterium]
MRSRATNTTCCSKTANSTASTAKAPAGTCEEPTTKEVGYAELHSWSNFSFLEGGSHPEELVERAADLGLSAIALTDRDGLYGTVRFASRARERKIPGIVGSELTFEDGGRIVLLVENADGYANLCELISIAQMRGSKGDARLSIGDLEARSSGLFALSGGPPGRVERALAANGITAAAAEATQFQAIFGERFYLELQQHLTEEEARRNERLVELGKTLGIAIVATNGVAYALKDHAVVADVLGCVKRGTTLEGARSANLLRPNTEYYLKPPETMRRLFAPHPEAIEATLAIAQRCAFRLERLTGQFPLFPVPPGETRQTYLREKVYRGAANRYGAPLAPNVERQLEYELGIIAKMDLAGYFLIVWDIVQKAAEFGVLCQGRGSAANSAVCYALGITAVDPIGMNLLFERFMSEERREIPDIDIDFAHQDREKILQYVYERYGRTNAAMAAEVVTYRARSALRDVGKALGLSLAQVETVAREFDARESLAAATNEGPIGGELGQRLFAICCRIDGFPRHMGIHSGGMVITRDPLVRVAPVEWATMRDRTIIQWDKDDLQELGLIKIDLLGLGMLSLLREAFSIHKRVFANQFATHQALNGGEEEGTGVAGAVKEERSHGGRERRRTQQRFSHDAKNVSVPDANVPSSSPPFIAPLALHTIPADDQKTYEMIQKADTIGVFQIESRAQQSMLPRMKPACFYDIVMQVAIIRPGPIQGQMVHPFLRRRAGLEPVTYPHPKLKPVLERTMGVPLFQEQGMRLAIEAAGFTPGEADQLRRAMGHKRSRTRMLEIYPRLIEGMVSNGIDRDAAEQLFHMLEGFADYGFPESHAASFALLAYASAYVKCHHPAIFAAAILNVQPMGFYSTEVLVNDARRHGVTVKPIEVNASEYWSHVDADGALRLGFHLVRGLGEAQKQRLESALAAGTFRDLLDFAQRTQLEKEAIENLAIAGAFAPWFASRREAMWALRALDEREARGELGKLMDVDEPRVRLRAIAPKQETAFDLWSTGVTAKGQAIEHFRKQLEEQRVIPAARLTQQPKNLVCRVGGMVITRQRPGTAKGFVFLTLEDETGLVNVIVRPDVYERYRRTIRTESILVVEGKLQKEAGCIDMLAQRVWGFDAGGITNGVRSHNFH